MLFVLFTGAIAGVLVWAFFYLMDLGIDLLWGKLPEHLAIPFYPVVLCLIGGTLIGLWAERHGDLPESLDVVMADVRRYKRYPYDDLGATAVAAILPLFFGGSIGPEAGLTGVISGLCTWVGDRMRWTAEELKELTDVGISATLGAVFGTPLFGLVAPVEAGSDDAKGMVIPRRTKIILNIAATFGAFGALLLLNSFVGKGGGLYRFDTVTWGGGEFAWAVPLVAVGLLAGLLYHASGLFTRRLGDLLVGHKLLRAIICGAALGAIGCLLPYTMFAGESQMTIIANGWQSLPLLILLLTGIVKLFVTPFCINFGWRGGNIFPVIFAGACIGFACAGFLGIDPVFSVALVVSSLCGCVMRKPLTVALLLMLCFPVRLLPLIALAALPSCAIPLPRAFATDEASDITSEEDGGEPSHEG